MSTAAAPQREPLLFPPEKRRRFPVVFVGFLLVSLVGHALTFFVFQVVYPQQVTIPTPAPPVTLLTGATEEGRALLRWIEAEDPALVASAPVVVPPDLMELNYRPSYLTLRTAPRGVPESPPTVQFPPARQPLAIIRSAAQPRLPAKSVVRPSPTRVAFRGEIAARQPQALPVLALREKSAAVMEPAEFLIGVNAEGEVRFTLLQKSSGQNSEAFDREAAAHLMKIAFEPAAGAALAWGFATVHWGDDAYQAESAE